MTTLNRINKLLLHVGLPTVLPADLQLKSDLRTDNTVFYRSQTPVHDVLDEIDDRLNVCTKWNDGHDGCCLNYGRCRRYVGARLALLEDCVALEEPVIVLKRKWYFHLGAEAETVA